MATWVRRPGPVIAGLLAVPFSALYAAAEEPSDAGEGAAVEQAAEELALMAQTLVRTRDYPSSNADARRELVAKFRSWPPSVRFASVKRLLARSRFSLSLKRRVINPLVEGGELRVDFARDLMAYVRDEDEPAYGRGHAMAVLLSGRLKDVAPRDELIELTKDVVADGPDYVRTKALVYFWILDEPSVIREVVRVVQVAQETDESFIWGPALASLRRCRAIPPDLREAVDELRDRARRRREEPGHRGESEPSASSGSEPEKRGVEVPASEGGPETPQAGAGEAVDRASDSASHNDLTVDDTVPADEVSIEASASAEKEAASQGHGITLYVAAGFACAAVFVTAVVARRFTKEKGEKGDRHAPLKTLKLAPPDADR